MIFDNQYLTYNEYIDLGGEQIGETPFNLLEFEGRKQIDKCTLNRLKNIESDQIPSEVKICLYNLINSVKQYMKSIDSISQSGNAISESIDGYSISYINPSEIKEVVKSKNNELNDIITTYLFGVIVDNEHLIYCGVE